MKRKKSKEVKEFDKRMGVEIPKQVVGVCEGCQTFDVPLFLFYTPLIETTKHYCSRCKSFGEENLLEKEELIFGNYSKLYESNILFNLMVGLPFDEVTPETANVLEFAIEEIRHQLSKLTVSLAHAERLELYMKSKLVKINNAIQEQYATTQSA